MKRGLVGLLLVMFILSILYSQFVFSEETVTQETSKNGQHEHSKFLTRKLEAVSAKPYESEGCVDIVKANSYVYSTCDQSIGGHTHQILYNGRWYTSTVAGEHNHEKFYRAATTTRTGSGGAVEVIGSDCQEMLHSGETNYGTCDHDKHVHIFSIEGRAHSTEPAPLYKHSKFYTFSENKGCEFGINVAQKTYGTCDKKGLHTHTITLPKPVEEEQVEEQSIVDAEPEDIAGEVVAEEQEPEVEEKFPAVNTRAISEMAVIFLLGIVIGALVFMRRKKP